jgi:hypothetical protein
MAGSNAEQRPSSSRPIHVGPLSLIVATGYRRGGEGMPDFTWAAGRSPAIRRGNRAGSSHRTAAEIGAVPTPQDRQRVAGVSFAVGQVDGPAWAIVEQAADSPQSR